jgi:hypothetical protein
MLNREKYYSHDFYIISSAILPTRMLRIRTTSVSGILCRYDLCCILYINTTQSFSHFKHNYKYTRFAGVRMVLREGDASEEEGDKGIEE